MKPILTEDGSNTLFSKQFGETYHSIHGAKTEALHVFVEASAVLERLNTQPSTRVLEIGFGLGLNFLLTADLALKSSGGLHYHAFEMYPLSSDLLGQLSYRTDLDHPGLVDLAAFALSDLSLSGTTQTHNSRSFTGKSNVNLEITPADVSKVALGVHQFDCIYLDAFSPNVNPECWDEASMGRYFNALKPGGKLSTYSAKGSVRRAMLDVGFDTRKLPGPPGKREILTGIRPLVDQK